MTANLKGVLNRLWQSVILVFVVTLITFFLINIAPGGPASIMRMDAAAEQRAALIQRLGLDLPLPARYARWLRGALKGDLGNSLATGEPVLQRIGERMPYTLRLTSLTLALSVVIGIVMGTAAALKRGTWIDSGVSILTVIGLSIPIFWLAIMLILLFSVNLRWLPSSGTGDGGPLLNSLRYLIMPVFVLSAATLPTIVRFTRSSMLEVLSQNFIRTARAGGLKRFAIIYRCALRNALIPVVSVIGVLIPRLLSGAVITEAVFGRPGMGRLILEGARGRDYPLVMGVTIVTTLIVIASNFIVDITYSRIDPRIHGG